MKCWLTNRQHLARSKEREERMKREEREFQLKMMSMLVQAPGPYSYLPRYMQAPSDYPPAGNIDEF